jgi:branched-chain amino acid transport system permease protein
MTLVGLLLIGIVVFAPQGLIEPVLALARRLRKGSAS